MPSILPPVASVAAPRPTGIQSPPPLATVPTASATAAPQRSATAPRIRVWDMASGIEQPVTGAQLLHTADTTISTAYAKAVEVDAFLRDKLGRDGWDGKGTPLDIVVHAPNEDGTPNMNNAYWDLGSKRIYIGDGDGETFAPLGGALDVVVHEATHAIVDSEVHLRYEGQQGGINESWADVLASIADPDDWKIGEDVYTPSVPGDAIRDLEHPRFGHVDQLPKGALLEPHDYSGIPSLAAVRVANDLGREEMGQIWYSALIDHLGPRSGYAGAARATLDAAVERHGASSHEVDAVLAAWKSVGVDPRWTRPKG